MTEEEFLNEVYEQIDYIVCRLEVYQYNAHDLRTMWNPYDLRNLFEGDLEFHRGLTNHLANVLADELEFQGVL